MGKKSLVVSETQADKLVGIGFTGHDIGQGNLYPSVVNILQSDKQYDAFSDGDSITKKDYGKLFVRTDNNVVGDLKDKIEGTIIKIERGYEIRNSDNKIEESGYGFLDAIEKDEYVQKGFKPINMVKVLLAIGTFAQVEKAMTKLNNKLSKKETVGKEDYPFTVVPVKGASFGNWFPIENEMANIAKEVFNRPLAQLPTIAFRLIVTSKKEEGSDFTYYAMDYDVKANDPDDAINFTPYLLEAKDQHLFYKVKERVENGEEVFDTMKDVAEVVTAKKVEEEEEMDLPF